MDQELHLKLQSFLDGELAEAEARSVSALVARDSDAAALLMELRNTRQSLRGALSPVQLPESRDFYWSKIAREIERLPLEEAPAPAVPWIARIQRWLVPLSAATAVIVLTTISLRHERSPRDLARDLVAELEVTSQDMGASTFRSQQEGISMVWLYDKADSTFTEDAPPANVEPQ